MANVSQDLLGELARGLVQGLTEGGTRDLASTRLSEMEGDVYLAADQLSGAVLQALLEQQAQQVQAAACPACGGSLSTKAPQTKTLLLKRNQVHWQQPVRRCSRCRRDFFPSGESARM